MTKLPRVAAALAASALLAGVELAAQDDAERELESVRERIGELESRIARETAERNRAADELRRVELEITDARAALRRLERDIGEQERRAGELADRQAAARGRLDAEREALAEQVRLTYVNGRREALRLLLNQETPADLGRMLVYYDYFNRARTRRVSAVAGELAELTRLADEAERVRAELEALRRERADELEALERSRAEREAMLAELDDSLESADSEVERLRREERRLVELVAELGELLAGFPVDAEEPFPRLKGRLAWPVAGEVVAEFGSPRGGGMRWNGVRLGAERGTTVRAVYHGRVAFADYLAGLGLLVVVDHGDGYMTLYAHNDALLKEPGDWVRPGEPIGEVGDTGGRAEPALYFEIRRDGEPVDPGPWIAD